MWHRVECLSAAAFRTSAFPLCFPRRLLGCLTQQRGCVPECQNAIGISSPGVAVCWASQWARRVDITWPINLFPALGSVNFPAHSSSSFVPRTHLCFSSSHTYPGLFVDFNSDFPRLLTDFICCELYLVTYCLK